MHDRTRRLLCRIVFLTLCVSPTLFIMTWICVVHSPAYIAHRRATWERTLSDQLGLIVSLEGVSHPTRGSTLLEGVNLSDAETGSRVARIRQIEMGRSGGQFILIASQPEIQGEQIWRLWEVLHERVLRGQVAAGLRAQLAAGEVTVHRADGEGASTLTDVRCQLAPTRDGPQATIEFRDVALQMAEPAQLRITRNRQISPPATRWELNTRTTALPCSLLADQFDVLTWLGEEATFQGVVEAMPTAKGWEGEITGRFRSVDLDRVVTYRYDHKLSGTAEITFRRAKFRGGKLIDAAGDVTCDGGVVSWSLLDQARRSLGLIADASVLAVEADTLWQYQQLKFGFTLNEEGLQIGGLCQSANEGVVMANRHGPLLTDKPQEIAQVVALVRTLASENGEQVPATPEAYQLLHVLPIPSDSETPRVAGPRPYTPARLELGLQ